MSIYDLQKEIITPDASAFLISLHEKFDNLRRHLLSLRRQRAHQYAQGIFPQFTSSSRNIRESVWSIAEVPWDLEDRRVEITGPAEPKMIINALNSPAKVFMADLEDALSPTWHNVLLAQSSLKKAVRRTLTHVNEAGRIYSLNEKLATLTMRPRGLHMDEPHFQIRGQSISASLFDFGLYFFHNAHELLRRDSGPYFYLAKLESQDEAAWWNDVFNFAQDYLKISRGRIRATVLIETLPGAFEMDEILYALKDHITGLNAGRWDYLFSLIKKFATLPHFVTPERAFLTMDTPFMDAYCRLLVQTCHRRGAHAIGGMAAFIPHRQDPELSRQAFQKVSEDKAREARLGFDGTWVAHPDLIPLVEEEFRRGLDGEIHQKNVSPAGDIGAVALLSLPSSRTQITEKGLRVNIRVSLLYFDRWFAGIGAVAINNLMEDAATAEISRSQLWQWLHHSVVLADARILTPELFQEILLDEIRKLLPLKLPYLEESVHLLTRLVLNDEFEEFFTIPAYKILNHIENKGVSHDSEFGTADSHLRQ